MGEGDTCDVCGGTETKLVDGFYYCAECGTQNTNVRETIVEHQALADGTFGYFSRTKYSVKIKDGVQMSAEWYKWHAYNFVLAGLTERLLRLGAEPSFKMKVLWIWAKYIRKHQNRKEMGLTDGITEIRDKTIDIEHVEEIEQNKPPPKMTLKLLICIMYLALNLDKSSVQLSHFRRYMKDGRINIHKCLEYVPKEIDTSTSEFKGLCCHSSVTFTPTAMPSTMRQFADLNLGPLLVPDLEGMIDNHLKELCLPNSLKSLVMSLISLAPINFLDRDKYAKKRHTLPDSECVVLSYVLVALKMCFGLDDDYEIRLSDAVDEINNEDNNLKAYKSDMYLEPSERLFSFREWCKYLLFRKYMLCKHYLPMARERNIFLDDYVYMEHSKKSSKKEVQLSDEVTMDIVNKIPEPNDFSVIPLSEFEPSATPLSNLTDVISRHARDPDTKRLLSEDFTQYSINYACHDLALPSYSEDKSENIIVGVSETGKTSNDLIGLHLFSSCSDSTLVYVKNCENKNWFKTKRPTAEHVVKVKDDSDHGYDSNIENSPVETNSNTCNSNVIHEETIEDVEIICKSIDKAGSREIKLEIFEEEEEGRNIFDDDFLDVDTNDTKLAETIQNFDNDYSETMETLRYEDSYNDINDLEDSKVGVKSADAKPTFDPATFNREETIKELMLAACREYKVRVPQKFRPRIPKKRKLDVPNVEAGASKPKKAKRDEASKKVSIEKKAQVKEIMGAYYTSLEHDVLRKLSEHVKSFVDNVEQQNARNYSIDQNSLTENDNDTMTEMDDQDHNNLTQNLENNSDQTGLAGNENNVDQNQVDGNKPDEESILDPVYKGDPEFSEKTHDTTQLYLKVKGELEPYDLYDTDDEEINTLIEENLKQSSKYIANNTYSDDDDDPLDDLPLSHFKKQMDQKRNYEDLIKNPEKLSKFNYWFKHYISQFFKKGDGVTKAFESDMKENFPRSFVFVLTECAAILNCSTYILYRYLTDIEEKMLQEDGYEKKMRSFKGTGIRLERRDHTLRYDIRKMKERDQRSRRSKS